MQEAQSIQPELCVDGGGASVRRPSGAQGFSIRHKHRQVRESSGTCAQITCPAYRDHPASPLLPHPPGCHGHPRSLLPDLPRTKRCHPTTWVRHALSHKARGCFKALQRAWHTPGASRNVCSLSKGSPATSRPSSVHVSPPSQHASVLAWSVPEGQLGGRDPVGMIRGPRRRDAT